MTLDRLMFLEYLVQQFNCTMRVRLIENVIILLYFMYELIIYFGNEQIFDRPKCFFFCFLNPCRIFSAQKFGV